MGIGWFGMAMGLVGVSGFAYIVGGPAALKALVKKLGIAEELPRFADAAKNLYVPQPNPKTGVIEQFDDYFKLEDASVEAVKARKIHPSEYLGGGQGALRAALQQGDGDAGMGGSRVGDLGTELT